MATLARLAVKIIGQVEDYEKSLDQADKATQGWAGKLKGLVGPAVAGAFLAAAVAVGAFVTDSINEFKRFEDSINEVFTLMPDLTGAAMDQMQSDLLSFNSAVGRMSGETVPALYQSISAGVPRENVFTFLEQAHTAALAGVTDLETAVDGLTSVVNSYGEEVIDAGRASDVMFTAVKLGKTTFEELSRFLFQVIPTAASLGVEFEQVGAAMAVMTSQGVPTSVAATQLRQLLVEVSTSTTDLAGAILDLTGKSFSALIAEGGNVSGILDQLRSSMPDDKFRELFGSVEAMNAALQISGPNFDSMASAMDEMANSAGATAEAAETMNSSALRLDERIAATTEQFKILLGEALTPSISKFNELKLAVLEGATALLSYKQSVKQVIGETKDFTGTTAGLVEEGQRITTLFESFNMGERFIADISGQSDVLNDRLSEIGRELATTSTSWDQYLENVKEATGGTDTFIGATGQLGVRLANGQIVVIGHAQALVEQVAATQAATNAAYDQTDQLTEQIARTQEMTAAENALAEARQYSVAPTLEQTAAMEEVSEKIARQNGEYITLESTIDAANRRTELSAEANRKAAEAAREHAEAVAELERKTGQYFQAAIDSEGAIGVFNESIADLESGVGNLTINQDTLNQSIYDAAAAAGGSAAELAILGGALGLYSEEAAEAALKSALIQAKIDELAQSYVSGGTTIAGMQGSLRAFIDEIEGIGPAVDSAAGSVDGATQAMSAADQALGEKLGAFGEAADETSGNAETAFGDIATAAEENMSAAGSIVDEQSGIMLEAFTTAMQGMATAATDTMPTVVTAVETGVVDTVTTAEGYTPQFTNVGYNFTTGLAQGVTNGTGVLTGAVNATVQAALDQAAATAGTQSPSWKTALIGHDFVAGFPVGFEDATPEMLEAIEDVINQMFDRAETTISQAGSIADIMRNTAERIADPLEQQLQQIDDRTAELTDSIAENLGGFLPDDLAGNIDQLIGEAQASGNTALLNDLMEYKRLQEERNEAEKEFEAIQQRLLEIEQKQQQLDFLNDQLDLIRTLQEAGLDPSQVLSGIELGLNASEEDLLNASGAVLDALINQANSQVGNLPGMLANATQFVDAEGNIINFSTNATAAFGAVETAAVSAAAGVSGAVDRMGNAIAQGATLAQTMVAQAAAAGVQIWGDPHSTISGLIAGLGRDPNAVIGGGGPGSNAAVTAAGIFPGAEMSGTAGYNNSPPITVIGVQNLEISGDLTPEGEARVRAIIQQAVEDALKAEAAEADRLIRIGSYG